MSGNNVIDFVIEVELVEDVGVTNEFNKNIIIEEKKRGVQEARRY